MSKRTFIVSFEVDDDVSDPEVGEYVYDAVVGWSGQYPPDHPCQGIGGFANPLSVKGWPKKKKRKTNLKIVK